MQRRGGGVLQNQPQFLLGGQQRLGCPLLRNSDLSNQGSRRHVVSVGTPGRGRVGGDGAKAPQRLVVLQAVEVRGGRLIRAIGARERIRGGRRRLGQHQRVAAAVGKG